MISVLPCEFGLIYALRNMGDWLMPVMKFFTWLGYPQAYMLIVAIIYWSLDRKLGLRLAVFLPAVASVNSILKQAFHAPRPYWVDPDLDPILVSNGFGMPSGHAQASTAWLYAASFLKNRGFWIMAVVTAILVGISRMYLGVHFPSQVLLGWMIGIVVLLLFHRYETGVLNWFLQKRMTIQLLWISMFSLLILVLGGAMVIIAKNWEMPPEWILNAADDLEGKGESILSSAGMGAVAGNAGGFLGTALGALLSFRQGGFDSGGAVWKRIIRSVTGLSVLAILYGFMTWISPDQEEELLFSVWRYSGFFLISFSAIYLIPLLFRRLGIQA